MSEIFHFLWRTVVLIALGYVENVDNMSNEWSRVIDRGSDKMR